MNSDIVIKAEGIGKRYKIGGQQPYKALRDTLTGAAKTPYRLLKGALNPRSAMHPRRCEDFWALKDVDFEIKRGEVVGLIGRNGAGKSTLLKILSQITEPTTGRIELDGRVGSLLEVGTGFHPELTGRENIFLNGAILGMKRREILDKFDEIVEFAEISKFLDTPVKHYSSGMYMRLAFSVAAHLEPEILLVDEVLAVGDAAFQKKCLGKMSQVSRQGRTVMLVSHNMTSIKTLCTRAIQLRRGNKFRDGDASEVCGHYLREQMSTGSDTDEALFYKVNRDALADQHFPTLRITGLSLNSGGGGPGLRTGDSLGLDILYEAQESIKSAAFWINISTLYNVELVRLSTMPISGFQLGALHREGRVRLHLPSLPLVGGTYVMTVGLVRERVQWLIRLEEVVVFLVEPSDVYGSNCLLDQSRGLITVAHEWTHERV